jgi:uncharacterized protein
MSHHDARIEPTERTRLRRKPERGRFDRAEIHAILDAGSVGHLGFAVDGRPWVLPMAYARRGESLVLHGSAANHALRSLAAGIEACFTVTLVDGLVFSRSAFHHSINYRAVMVFGVATPVEGLDEQRAAMLALVEQVVPGRSVEVRHPSDRELRATRILQLPIVEASAKVRTGPAIEEPEDLASRTWGGEVPLHVVRGEPIPDALVPARVEPPPTTC